MRRRFVQINGELVEMEGGRPRLAHDVMGDIKPYQSMITGETITSRSQHREHLRKHGCVEVGNDVPMSQGIPDVAPQQRHELIRSQIDRLPHRDFRAAIKRDIDRIKWNSRKD